MFSCMCKNVLPAYSSAKTIKIKQVYDHKCTATFFMNHSANDHTLQHVNLSHAQIHKTHYF